MTAFVQLLLALALLISAAKLGGMLSLRLRQPAVLGELLIGVLLGPTLLDLLHLSFFTDPQLEATIFHLAELGVVFLMFVAGLEMDLSDMGQTGKVAFVVGFSGVVAPLVLGMGVALIFGYQPLNAAYMGMILTATSVSISAQTLIELKLLRSRVGLVLLGAAVIDDVMVILLLSLFLALFAGPAAGGLLAVGWILLRMVAYLGGITWLGQKLVQPLLDRAEQLPISQPVMTVVLISVVVLAWSAEVLGGIAAITGAFLAGVLFARTQQKQLIERSLQTLTYALLVPIFFVSIGLHANARALGADDLVFALAITLVAIMSKIIGCGIGAKLSKMSTRESLQVGIGMISRGEVGLIVATVGRTNGLIGDNAFAIVVLVVLVTTLVTPPLLKWSFRGTTQPHSIAPPVVGLAQE